MSNFSAKKWRPPCSSRKTRNMWSHHSCHAASRCPRRRVQCCDEQTPGTNRSQYEFPQGWLCYLCWFLFFFCIYIYIYHLYPEAMEALHLQNDFKKALGGFLTVFLTAFGESAPFDSDVCAWLQVQKSRFAGTRKIFSRQATSTRTYQNCIPTIPRDVQENWGDFPTTFWVPWNRKIHELCWRWPPSKHAWPNVMRPSSEVAGPHGCANDWRWFSMTYHQNGWFQWKNCGVFWMQNLQTMDGFNWWITETLGATWFVMHHGGSAMDFALQATLQTGAEVGDLQRLRDFAEELWRWDRSDRSLKPTERCFIFKYLVGNLLKPFNTSSILY